MTRIRNAKLRLTEGRARGEARGFEKGGTATMFYELRVYHCVPGRLPALHKRFSDITLKLWEKHGIKQAGFFTDYIGDNCNAKLTYLLAWESLAERQAKWDAFAADPEWIAKRAETEKDGPIVARLEASILQPTPYSSVK